MNQIMKFFMGIFMVLFLGVSSMGVLGAFLEVLKGQQVHAMMIDELENSDYSKAVADACFCYAKEAGYELELTLYETEGGWKIYSRQEDLPVSTDTVTMAKVCLKYPLTIPMWGMVSRQELTGYAR